MTRQKKSRKPGPLAPSLKPKAMVERVTPEDRVYAGKGRKPGSRFNVASSAKKATGNTAGGAKDPRHGSKQPIALIKPQQAAPIVSEAQKRAAAEAELAQLENDSKLQLLLERLDNDEELTAAELRYVDTRTERFEQLAELLGLEVDEDDDD
ncbi:Der GTPase-activating protein YihI [Pseudidiomarina mangrovi]|uniref:Der GTPase-activating protein YihI n=1 Tax=Pseudidiomarina mangrovi TaxID=2487133 RepID=UPI000FCCD9E4|nr:Der GTPase-activating protein YihI [Pseudidiomarina mangrovi]CAI8152756.1 MAG: Der GTPase-activating protein YihI [Pseudidiomarina mangrovi]